MIRIASTDSPEIPVWAASILIVICSLFMFVLGNISAERHGKERAIKAGVAHYEVDPVTGITTFTWNTPKPEKP